VAAGLQACENRRRPEGLQLRTRQAYRALQHDHELRLDSAVRPRSPPGRRRRPRARRADRRLAAVGHQRRDAGRAGDVHVCAGRSFQVSGIQQDFRGANNYRPNLTCDPYAAGGQQTIDNWFNKDCVVIPTDPSQPFGNAPRNNVRGPNFWSFDLAAVKRVAMAGTSALELRVEAFNLFNRTNFAPPNGIRTSGGFGTITAAYDPRQVQLGVKVLW